MSDFEKALDAYGRAVIAASEYLIPETRKAVEKTRKAVLDLYETNRCDGCNPWSEDE